MEEMLLCRIKRYICVRGHRPAARHPMKGEGSSGDIQESKQARTQKVASRACATWKADGMPPGIRCQLTIPGHLAIFSTPGMGSGTGDT